MARQEQNGMPDAMERAHPDTFRVVPGLSLAVWGALMLLAAQAAGAPVEGCVPADATVLFKVRDLARHYQRLRSSEIVRTLADESVMPELAAALRKADESVAEFERRHNVNAAGVLRQMFGREFALAAFPRGASVLLVRGYNEKSLREGLNDYLRVQRKAGALLGARTSRYKGMTLHSRNLAKGQRHHVLTGDILAASHDLEALHRVIDVIRGDLPALSSQAWYKEADDLIPEEALLRACIDMTRTDPWLPPLAKRPGLSGFLSGFAAVRLATILSNARYAALSLCSGDMELKARLTVVYQEGRLPASLRAAFPEAGSKLNILKLTPGAPVLTVARSINFEAVWDAYIETLRTRDPAEALDAQRKLQTVVDVIDGAETKRQLFEALGSQAALFVVPDEKAGALPGLALALELRDTARLPKTARAFIGAAALLWGARNDAPVRVESSTYRGIPLTVVRIMAPDLPGGLNPTLGLVDTMLALTSSPEVARGMIDASLHGSAPEVSHADGTVFFAARLSFREMGALLARHEQSLVRFAAKSGRVTEEAAMRRLKAVANLLSLFGTADVVASFRAGRTDHVATLRFSGAEK